jgi:hydroxymethylpyrimidine pyrophosphatase-like HAD family hydrolase
MQLIEMTVEEAMQLCGKQAKVLVAVQNLEDENDDNLHFTVKQKDDYDKIFEDVKTVASQMNDLVKQLRCFTCKQNLLDIKPKGVQKIVLLK